MRGGSAQVESGAVEMRIYPILLDTMFHDDFCSFFCMHLERGVGSWYLVLGKAFLGRLRWA